MQRVAIVTGASSGLGLEIAHALKGHDYTVLNWSLETGVDVSQEHAVRSEAKAALARYHQIDVVVNCAGINHIEWIAQTDVLDWQRVMDCNCKSIFLMAKHCAPLMKRGTFCNIISNASHVPMTASIAYNASKGAAAIMTRQMARELWAERGHTVFGISPNKLAGTEMSKRTEEKVPLVRGWTPEEAAARQKQALLIGEETSPETLAEFVGFLLSTKERHRYLAGCILEYGL